MKRLLFPLVFYFFLTTSVSGAEMSAFEDAPRVPIPSNIVNPQISQDIPLPHVIDIPYGSLNLSWSNGSAQEVKIDHRLPPNVDNSLSFVQVAQAAEMDDLTPEGFENLWGSIQGARQLKDLKNSLAPGYFQKLQAQVESGVSQYVVLANMQILRPQKIHIRDFNIENSRAEFLVSGHSLFGPVQGLVQLVKIEGDWKIDQESWYAGGKDDKRPIGVALKPLEELKYYGDVPSGLFAEVSPDYEVPRNFLSLAKVPYSKDKEAVSFVFLMNEDTMAQEEQVHSEEGGTLKNSHRQSMHVVWTWTKRFMVEQKRIANQYPVDVSIANDEDGYAPRQWNLVLPEKKPREAVISLLWAF